MSIKAGWSEKLVLQMPKEVLESFAGRPQRCFYICCQCCHDVKYVIEGDLPGLWIEVLICLGFRV